MARQLLAIALGLAMVCCSQSPSPAQLNEDNPVQPPAVAPYGMEEFFTAASHQPDPQRARLGRWLFFDARLSSDRTVSCATCHKPEFAFSDNAARSTGIGGKTGVRKTQSLVNLGMRTLLPGTTHDPGDTFFWDGRATSLEQQALMPIANPDEMGMSHPAMIERLSEIPGYQRYFTEAFGTSTIAKEEVATALADYVRTRRSGIAPYDRWAYGRETRALSAEQQRGSDIFFFSGSCASCHAGFNFSDGLFWNLGVGWNEKNATFADFGRAAVSHDSRDQGAFKTPGLRDVEKHAPYMHDGSIATLRDVVLFYNRGGNKNPRLTPRLRPLGMSEDDVDALVAFLRALSGEGYQDRAPRYFPQQ